ncbi:MAG: HDOD domain-containing protein [Verrucomicrobia bacterium]|nr:HDOD domain-containing protein [Verrucomicrobiota bacterium]
MKSSLIDIDALIAYANDLPALPQSTIRLAALVGAKQDNVAEVMEIVAFDPALTFKLIRAANSAMSGSSQPITTARDAVVRLGMAQVFGLAVANSVRPHMHKNIPEYGFSDGEFWRHSVAAAVATEVAQPWCGVAVPPEAFTAAMLHDIGKLIMARHLSTDVLELLQQARLEGHLTPLEAETKVLNVHHGELGGIIAQHWQFPERIVKGIVFHHNPEDGADPICDVVCMGNLAARKIEAGLANTKLDLWPDAGVLQRLVMTREGFEELCRVAVQRFEQVRTRYNVK